MHEDTLGHLGPRVSSFGYEDFGLSDHAIRFITMTMRTIIAIAIQNPISTPKNSVVPHRLSQSCFQFIVIPLYNSWP